MPRFDLTTQRLPRYLTQEETRAFFAVIRDHRDRALFALIYLYGLRVGEVALLTRTDADLDRSRIIVKRLKGGAWTERPLFSWAHELLASHVAALSEAGPDAPLFPGNGGALQKRQIQSLFSKYRDAAGIQRAATTHSLRHSIATHLLDAGLPLEFVQEHLGHQRLSSSAVYARITSKRREALFQRLESSPWIVQPTATSNPSQDPESGKENPTS